MFESAVGLCVCVLCLRAVNPMGLKGGSFGVPTASIERMCACACECDRVTHKLL